MSALAALCGAGIGLGLLIAIAGWRGVSLPSPAQRKPREAGEHLAGRLALAVGAGVAVGGLTGWPVGALLAAGAGLALPTLMTGSGERSVALARTEAIAGWAEMLRDTMAGAAGLEQAITATAPVAPPPIRGPVVALAGELERGARLAPALRRFADAVGDPTADLVVAALLLAAEHQTRRLADLLGTLAGAAREQASMRLRIEAGRARTRTSVRVILAATASLTLGLAILNRSY
ncbi:MAG: type II secretion system F family protein, partial [Mycobacteriales bacterium]